MSVILLIRDKGWTALTLSDVMGAYRDDDYVSGAPSAVKSRNDAEHSLVWLSKHLAA